MLKKIYLFIAVVLLSTVFLHAQVTTSSITGIVKGDKNTTLAGATVVLTHTPTGTVYNTTTKNGGVFNIQNINPGGPYTLEVSNVGYETYSSSNINIPLGEIYQAAVDLTISSRQLTEVVVTGTAKNQRIGAATNISRTQITNLPNLSRSLLNIVKLTPQSNGGSFLGMSDRFNNITVDGSIFNNNFGLGSNALPGGASQPISIDAIDQVQVNLAPYDVRQAGFTGAGVNAVTRRGTNNWYGTVYDYYKNQNFNGKKVDGKELPEQLKSSSNILGASIGGPIIKNKLFFFINGEYESRTAPGQTGIAQNASHKKGDPNVLDYVTEEDMNKVSDFLKTKGYDPGTYQGYDFGTTNKKFLARIDWNINDRHRLTARYNQSQTSDDVLTNTSSGPNPRLSNGRSGGSVISNGLNFSNSNYQQNNDVYSGVLELNSKLSGGAANQLLASFTKIRDYRGTPGPQFPFVDIMRDKDNVLMSFGSEIYSYKNSLDNSTWNISDNFSWSIGRHNLLAGASFDYLTFVNSFANYGGQSYYRFASINDFITGAAPVVYAVTYSNTDRTGITPAEAKFGQLGFYLQDNFTVNSQLKLTYGARFDIPFYPGTSFKNDALAAAALRDRDGNPFKADVGVWPKARLLVSPRVGFNYDITEDKSWVLRGGTGIFTGRIPFVWLVNQSSDNGVLNTLFSANAYDKNKDGSFKYDMSQYPFSTDRTAHVPNPLPANAGGNTSASYYSVTAPEFKVPQVWRSNLALDKRFGNGYTATIEGIYSKTLNSVYHYNANLGNTTGTLNATGDTRPVYSKSLLSDVGQVFVMDNNSKGYSFALTGQLQKTFSQNWQASVAYTYSIAKDVSPNNGDRSQSSWTQNAIINDPNHPELGYSAYSVPHRVTAFASYRFEYANKSLASTISLFYSGSSQERYLYRYSGDLNSDGATNDLLYVPGSRDGLESMFTQLDIKDKTGKVVESYTPAQQADAFWAFVEKDKYLKKHKGDYVDRYGALLPWVNRLDLRFLQDLAPVIGGKKHTFQISLDMQNFLSLLNSSWGNQYTYNYGTYSDQAIAGADKGKYTFLPSNASKPVYDKYYGLRSTWSMQLGIRYIF